MFFDDLESKLASDQTICKSILRDVKCPVHKLKARIIYDYDNEFTYAHITEMLLSSICPNSVGYDP